MSGREDRNGPLALNEAQLRALSAAVRRLWEHLDAIERALDPGPSGPYHVPVDDVDPAVRASLGPVVGALRRELTVLAALVGVAPERRSARAQVAALATAAWSVVEGLRPDRLRRYGALDPAAADLAPILERLAAGFIRLAQDAER